jgi:hypothetical protein
VSEKIDAILIDDEEIQRLMWTLSAEKKGKKILVFASVDEFYQVAQTLNRHIPVYIDSQLKNGVRGEKEAQKIVVELGFQKVILTTGMDPESIQATPYLSAIQGKEPPQDW